MLLCAKSKFINIYEKNNSSYFVNTCGLYRQTLDTKNFNMQKGSVVINIFNILGDQEIEISLCIKQYDYFAILKKTRILNIKDRYVKLQFNSKNKKIKLYNNANEFANLCDNDKLSMLIQLANSRIIQLYETPKINDEIYNTLFQNIGAPIDVLYTGDGDQCLIYFGYSENYACVIFCLYLNKYSNISGYYYNILCHADNIMSYVENEPGVMVNHKDTLYTLHDINELFVSKSIPKGLYNIEQYRYFDNHINGAQDENN